MEVEVEKPINRFSCYSDYEVDLPEREVVGSLWWSAHGKEEAFEEFRGSDSSKEYQRRVTVFTKAQVQASSKAKHSKVENL